MRTKIGRKIYDTTTSQEVGRQTVSFFGDPYGFEEIMFQKTGRTKEYFLLVNGGSLSQYNEEEIIPLNLADARAWLLRITGEEHTNYLIPEADLLAEVKDDTTSQAGAEVVNQPKPKAKKTTCKTKKACKPKSKK